ncbi:type IV secretory pathway VirB4 component-like protein (plasmid) [Jeotgalibacillus malaysiensis]|uniref:Type IV secretory pathway VirB4 component-like protein n=1 Tax=Jeotgalibacillus malaysiensis TaxID=1508404 RepID=A0A0B5AU10_9BACL|nr:DUF87 domain-containing protein [Jeotgalibacillus malaysiensis]AJD93556.1 type IV secretory pathway VirB4 component-like protein [Jeotgalibacillus malaysiensis]
MGKKKKKKQVTDETFVMEDDSTGVSSNIFEKGMTDIKDYIAPPSFERNHHDYLRAGEKFVRSYVMTGFPSSIRVGWLDSIIHGEADTDLTIHINPADERTALDELTNKITQFEAQLYIEQEKGSIRNESMLRNKITSLYSQRERLEQNFENLFHIQIGANLFADSKEELEKEAQKIDNKLKGNKTYLMPTYLRQAEGYKTSLPFGKTYIPDLFRNFNTGALTACFPFYNAEISHETGVFIGVNLETNTPVMIDFYDRKKLFNSNVTVFGQAGSGKTFAVSLLTMRSALRGVRTVIIDPENEYQALTKALGGAHISIATDSKHFLNPFDVESEVNPDDGIERVDLKSKAADILNLIAVMAGGLNAEQRSIVATVIKQTYEDFGFSEDPSSLLFSDGHFDEESGIFYAEGMRKPMPTFSDFHERLDTLARSENNRDTQRLSKSLEIYKKGGIYDLFDCHTSEELTNFKNAPIVTFDISQLEESILRPIGMYVALSWAWEKFAKKNRHIKKRIVCDEAWMLVNKNMAGHEYTGQFLENCSRRIRKRNGGLLVASQNFMEFADSQQGQAVLKNAVTKILLKQDSTDIDGVQDMFKLSDGERNFLLQAQRGEALIKMSQQSSVAYVLPFDYEVEFISKANQQITEARSS